MINRQNRKLKNGMLYLNMENKSRKKVHAQRKFAQGSIPCFMNMTSKYREKSSLPDCPQLIYKDCFSQSEIPPKTEDFLAFLCFRGTPLMEKEWEIFDSPSHVNFLDENRIRNKQELKCNSVSNSFQPVNNHVLNKEKEHLDSDISNNDKKNVQIFDSTKSHVENVKTLAKVCKISTKDGTMEEHALVKTKVECFVKKKSINPSLKIRKHPNLAQVAQKKAKKARLCSQKRVTRILKRLGHTPLNLNGSKIYSQNNLRTLRDRVVTMSIKNKSHSNKNHKSRENTNNCTSEIIRKTRSSVLNNNKHVNQLEIQNYYPHLRKDKKKFPSKKDNETRNSGKILGKYGQNGSSKPCVQNLNSKQKTLSKKHCQQNEKVLSTKNTSAFTSKDQKQSQRKNLTRAFKVSVNKDQLVEVHGSHAENDKRIKSKDLESKKDSNQSRPSRKTKEVASIVLGLLNEKSSVSDDDFDYENLHIQLLNKSDFHLNESNKRKKEPQPEMSVNLKDLKSVEQIPKKNQLSNEIFPSKYTKKKLCLKQNEESEKKIKISSLKYHFNEHKKIIECENRNATVRLCKLSENISASSLNKTPVANYVDAYKQKLDEVLKKVSVAPHKKKRNESFANTLSPPTFEYRIPSPELHNIVPEVTTIQVKAPSHLKFNEDEFPNILRCCNPNSDISPNSSMDTELTLNPTHTETLIFHMTSETTLDKLKSKKTLTCTASNESVILNPVINIESVNAYLPNCQPTIENKNVNTLESKATQVNLEEWDSVLNKSSYVKLDKISENNMLSSSDLNTSVLEIKSNQKGKLLDAPTFYPSESDFKEPIEYLASILIQAYPFGICRIVPPSSFKSECHLNDEMRFTAYNHYIHKMFKRWGPAAREIAAIQHILHSQGIKFDENPWLGSIQIDLCRLYDIVKSLGGLQHVIDKNKWQKVAELLKVPRNTQDTAIKLYNLYCKYLLPYETLSDEEREMVFKRVEENYKNKRLFDCFHEREDWDDCVVKGRNVSLSQFYRTARNLHLMWFPNGSDIREIENEYWNLVKEGNRHVCVQAGSIDSGCWGCGFPCNRNKHAISKHPWNLKILSNNPASVLRSMGPLVGVTIPTVHVAMLFSTFCWYRDPHNLPWIEYLHTGASKIWYSVPETQSVVFHEIMKTLVPEFCHSSPIWLSSDTTVIPPSLLLEYGVTLTRIEQQAGQFIVVLPQSFICSIATGYLVSESVYFASSDWLNTASQAFQAMQESSEPSGFSLEKLIFSFAEDQRAQLSTLKIALPIFQNLIYNEIQLRLYLKQFYGTEIENKYLKRENKKNPKETGITDKECDKCRKNLFVSYILFYAEVELNKTSAKTDEEENCFCLNHGIEFLKLNPTKTAKCTLVIFYNDKELENLVTKVKDRIKFLEQKKNCQKKL